MYFRKILVGLDLEVRDIQSEEIIPELTRKVFDRALKMAIAQRGQLKLCAAVEGLDLTHVPASPMQVNALTGYLVERLEVLEEEARAAGVECESDLLGGVAWAELTREANDFDADLLIVGGGVSPDRFGSTAMKVLRNASCPVLVERSHDPKIKVTSQPTNEMSAAISSASSDDGDEEPQHVLIADDLSDVGQQALMSFVGSGLWRDAKCWLAHVVEPIHWPEAWRYGRPEAEVALHQAGRIESTKQALYQHLNITDHRTMTYGILPHVLEGNAVDTLLRLIGEWQIDLLVCGTASRAKEPQAGFGSVAETLLPHVPCSVLAFKP